MPRHDPKPDAAAKKEEPESRAGEQCSGCVFYAVIDSASGSCRALPPVPALKGTYVGGQAQRFPVVRAVEWCGQWSALSGREPLSRKG